MQREIKFRGKRVDGGGWVYGDLVNIQTSTGPTIAIKDTPYNVNNGYMNIIPVKVIPETVGQFTGLKDKNGVDIYEGDVIKYQYLRYRKPIVVLTEVYWEYHGFYIKKNETKVIDSRVLTLKNHIEVAGNIHDNPQLLTK